MNLLNGTDPSDPTSPQKKILQMCSGFFVSQSIFIAAKLGIADLLARGSKHCDDLAEETGIHSDSLYRFMRALSGIGVFSETGPKYFALTPLAACLQSNEPGSLKNYIIFQGEYICSCWRELLYSLKTGKSASEHIYGMNMFQYFEQNKEAGSIFHQAMAELLAIQNDAILPAYDFSSIETLTDVGGGQGHFLSELLLQYPNMKAVLFDIPQVIEKAEAFLEEASVGKRCELIPGSFLDFVPAGTDAYLLKHVIHNWDDQNALRILQNCRKAMAGKGRLLVIEAVISENTPWRSKFKDLDMMLVFSGRTRTEEEFQNLFESSGFKLAKIFPTNSVISIIEGTAA